MYYAIIDTETGGTDPFAHSLLTVCIAVVHRDTLEPVDMWNCAIAHDRYSVTSEALQVNGINLAQHAAEAIPLVNAQGQCIDFLRRYVTDTALIPCGWNVQFDINFLRAQLLKEAWPLYFGYHALDVQSVARFMADCGKVDRGGLAATADVLHIDTYRHHTADVDVEITRQVLLRLRALV